MPTDEIEEPEKEEPPYYCPRCDREYPTMDIMVEHVDEAHPDYGIMLED